jgi:phage baseplate assembly protein W
MTTETKYDEHRDLFGRDLLALYLSGDGRHENADVDVSTTAAPGGLRRDLLAVTGLDNAVQAVIHRLKTMKGELAPLGHPDYGSRHHELIGEPNSEHNRNLVKLYILQALAREPRVAEVLEAKLDHDPQRDRDKVNLHLTLRFIETSEPRNLVIPFSFEGRL